MKQKKIKWSVSYQIGMSNTDKISNQFCSVLMWQLWKCLRNPKRGCLRHQKTVAVGWKYSVFCPERGLLGCIYCGISVTVPRNIPGPWNLIICIVNLLELFLASLQHILTSQSTGVVWELASPETIPSWLFACSHSALGRERVIPWVEVDHSLTAAKNSPRGLVQWYGCSPCILRTVIQLARNRARSRSFISDFLLATTDIIQGDNSLRKNRFHLFSLGCCIYPWRSIHWPFVV